MNAFCDNPECRFHKYSNDRFVVLERDVVSDLLTQSNLFAVPTRFDSRIEENFPTVRTREVRNHQWRTATNETIYLCDECNQKAEDKFGDKPRVEKNRKQKTIFDIHLKRAIEF